MGENLWSTISSRILRGDTNRISGTGSRFYRKYIFMVFTKVSAPAATSDADAIHVAGRGIPTTVLSIPLRYMHNPAEVCSMSDVQACIDVLAEFLCSIGPDICLKPLEA